MFLFSFVFGYGVEPGGKQFLIPKPTDKVGIAAGGGVLKGVVCHGLGDHIYIYIYIYMYRKLLRPYMGIYPFSSPPLPRSTWEGVSPPEGPNPGP